MHSDARRGRELDKNVFVVELHRIVTGRSRFVSMLEASGVIASDRRYQEDVAVIGNACAAEMCVAEAVNLRIGVVIARAAVPTCEPRVRAELDHAVRHDRARERVTMPARADERIDVAGQIALGRDGQGEQKQQEDRIYKDFQNLQGSDPVNHENLVNPV